MPGPTPSSHTLTFSDKRPKPVTDSVVPKPPKWLNKEARKIYKEVAKKIVSLGIAGSCDQNILSLFSVQMARLIAISKAKNLDEDLSSARMLNDLTAQTLSLMKEIGLTPSARAKMRLAKIESADPLADLLNDE